MRLPALSAWVLPLVGPSVAVKETASCQDLLALPQESESTKCITGDCSCQVSVEEVVWLVLNPEADGSAGIEYRARSLTPAVSRWIDQALGFLEGGDTLDASFRELWAALAGSGALAEACPEATEAAALLWSVTQMLSACWFGTSANQVLQPSSQRLAGAWRKLEGICERPDLLSKLSLSLVNGHGGGAWSRPFWQPVANARPLDDAALFASAARATALQPSLAGWDLWRLAFLDWSGYLEAAQEAWPAGWTLYWLQEQSELPRPNISDGCDALYYIGIPAAVQSEWLVLAVALSDYLRNRGWDGCYLTGSVEHLLVDSRGAPAELSCIIRQHAAALRFCARHYIILDDESGLVPPDPEAERHFEYWGGQVPRQLLQPWRRCETFGQLRHCPGGSDKLLHSWDGGRLLGGLHQLANTPAKAQVSNSALSGPEERSLVRWITRRSEAESGNSLCFARSRQEGGFNFKRCCEDFAEDCFDGQLLTALSCCRSHSHRCADLRLHVADYSFPGAPSELGIEAFEEPLRCLGDDLYRGYFDEVRMRMGEKTAEKTMQDGILGTRVEMLVANQAPMLLDSCPEVALLGRIVVTQRICQNLLQNPLSPEAQDKQETLIADVQEVLPSLSANQAVGYLTGVPQQVVSDLLSGACGKMLQADREPEEVRQVMEPTYRWPQASIASRTLEDHGLGCEEAAPMQVGELENVTGYDEVPTFFADLDHLMPADGRLTEIDAPAMMEADQGLRLDVILLRPQRHAGAWRFERRGELVLLGGSEEGKKELLVWRGDILAFAGIGVRIPYRMCSSCLTAELPKDHSSYLAEVRKQGYTDLGPRLQRAYSWTAKLFPMRCRPDGNNRAAELPALRWGPAPATSRAFCSPAEREDRWGSEWEKRSCRFHGLCYDIDSQIFEFYSAANTSSEDFTVALSMFSDVRTAWHPTIHEARSSEVAWVDVPVYLAMRHAAQNWGHHAVETSLALYALIMSHEDLFEPSGNRLLFFLDACSLELQGDAIEFCMRFVPNSISCLQDISSSCAKFTRQLWPLLSDWAPLEKGSVQERLPGVRTLCFSSAVAGLGAWKRPVQTRDASGRPLTQQEWAADPLLAPVVRHFRVHALARLQVPRTFEASPLLLAAIKRERRSLRNRDQVLEWLRTSAARRRLGFAELDFAKQTLADQARLLASTALFVASMGATLLAGILLPAEAAVIALPACHKVGPGRTVTCETEQILAACGLRWGEYPVEFDDVFYTIGRGFDFTARRDVLESLMDELLFDMPA